MVAQNEAVDAPLFSRHTDSRQQREGITATREARARHAILLASDLQDPAVVESLPVKPAIEIGILVSCRDVGPGVGISVLDAPAAHVDTQLAARPLDAQMLEGP